MENSKIGCFGYILVALFNIIIGGLSVNYILSWFGKDIPFIADMAIGLFVAELIVS